MALSYDLISQFAKLAVGDKKTKSESTVYGTVVVDGNGNKYVKLDNSDQLTPLAEDNQPTLDSTSADANEGERVSVLIKDHTATVTGNISSPAARTGDVADVKDSVSKIQEFDILVGERLQANEAYIKELQTDKANVGDLTAATAKITELEASKASVDELNATKAEITDLVAKKIDADIVNATYATIESLDATNADISNLEADYGEFKNVTTDNFEAVDATIKNLDTKYASIETLEAEQARITKLETDSLTAESATIKNLEADVGNIDTLIFGSASGDVIQSSFANAVIAQLGNAQIKAAMIENVNADQITAGDILTNNVRVMSEDGKLLISDETIQISDDDRVRVQIGKDASGDYSISIWDANGNLMFSEGGITDSAIKDAIIRNDMVSEDANISASKLNISSLFSEINNSTETIKSTKIYLDDEKQTLDVAFASMSSEVGDLSDTVSSQGTELSVIQGKIESKVWQQDIDDATDTLSNQYSILEQTVDNISMTVGSHETILNDAMLAPKIEGNGTSVVEVTNALGNSIDNLKFYGKTTQTTIAGNQLANLPDVAAMTSNGVVWSCSNGVVTATGTTTGLSSTAGTLEYSILGKIGTFYVSGNTSNVTVYCAVTKAGSTKWYRNTSFTLDGTETQALVYVQINSTGVTVNETVYPMVNVGTSALPWEPYVGGVPSPNPDYPQSLNSIGIDGSIDYRVCGKNLLPYPYSVTDTLTQSGITFTVLEDGGISLSGTATAEAYFNFAHRTQSPLWLPNGTYTYSFSGNSVDKIKGNVQYDNGGTTVTLANFGSSGKVTFNNDMDRFVGILLSVKSGVNVDGVIVYPMLESGTTATEYEPYVGSQILSVATPDGLHGIPVYSGGNRTDANGQQWICDEIDLKRGVYVQRIMKYTLTGTESWKISSNTVKNGVRFDCNVSGYPTAAIEDVLSSHCVYSGINKFDTSIGMNMWVAAALDRLYPRIVLPTGSTVETLKTFLQEEKTKGTPVEMLYALNTPIETPLDAETLATFAGITNEPGDVNIFSETDTEIELSEITSNKDLEGIKKRVSNAETAIEQNTKEIGLRATRDEVTETLSGYYTIEEADANVQISADSVLTSVSKTYATKNELAETEAKISPKIEGNGTPVVKVTNALGNSIDNLKFYGKTTQVSIPGRNKVDLLSIIGEDYTNTLNGVTVKIEDGYAVFSGTHTNTGWSNVLYSTGGAEYVLPAGTYTSKITLTLKSVNSNASLGNKSNTFTIEEDAWVSSLYYAFRGEQTISLSVPLVVAEGTTALTEYEPYVGGVPSPNPDYPQSLNSIGEDGSIDYRACGKNILDVHSSGVYYNADSTSSPLNVSAVNNGFRIDAVADVSSTWARYGYYLGTKEELMGKTITVSAKYTTSRSGDTAKPSICLYSIGGATQGYIGNTTKTPQGRLAQIENAPLTYTIDDSCPYDYVAALFLYSYGGAWVTGDWAQWDDIQVEVSDTATEYEPYASSVPYDNAVSIPHVFTLDLASIAGEDYTNTLNGVTVKIENGYAVFSGEYTSSEWANVLYIHDLPLNQYVIPAGTYASNVSLQLRPIGSYDGGNYSKTFTITEPMWLYGFYYAFGSPQTVSLSVPLTVTDIPSGLHGIPVSSGGNRADVNGQHWICDEIDLKRGVYIQRIGSLDLGTLTYGQSATSTEGQYRFAASPLRNEILSTVKVSPNNVKAAVLSTGFVVSTASDLYLGSYGTAVGKDGDVYIRAEQLNDLTTDEVKAAVSGLMLYYALAEPIETPLDAETLATFAGITNEPGTVIAIAESDIDVELSEIASNRAVETTASNIRETITEQNTSILSTCESIVLSATESVVKTDEFDTYKGTTKAEMELMSDNIGFKFSETSDRIDATNESLNDEITERNKHILFDQNGITIQAGENSLKLHLDNDKIYFEKNGVEFGYWDGVDFYTGNIIIDVKERAQFGNFAYIPRTDGSLSFYKVADTAGFYVRLITRLMIMYGTNSTLEDTTLNISDVSGTLTETTLTLGGE